VKNMPYGSQYIFEDKSGFNAYFGRFLQISFGYQLIDLLPTIQFAASFFILPMNHDPPAGSSPKEVFPIYFPKLFTPPRISIGNNSSFFKHLIPHS